MAACSSVPVEAGHIGNIVSILHTCVEHRVGLVVERGVGAFSFAFVDAEHLLVVDEYLIRKTLDDPLVHQGVEGSDPFLGVPFKAFVNEIVERVTLTHKYLVQRLR